MAAKTSEGSIKWQLCYDISARTWWMRVPLSLDRKVLRRSPKKEKQDSEQTPPRGTTFEGESRREQGEGIKSLYDRCCKGPLENAARSANDRMLSQCLCSGTSRPSPEAREQLLYPTRSDLQSGAGAQGTH
ncbi:unnamed protein product [Leuciscus chuanchicus]